MNLASDGSGVIENKAGLFDVSEDLKKDQERMQSMMASNPEKAMAIFDKYHAMVEKSEKGDLAGVLALMAVTGHGAPPAWFAVKMFTAGVMNLRLEVPRFMSRNGFNCKMGPLPTLLLDLVTKNAQVAWEDKMREQMGGAKSTAEQLKEQGVRDRKYVEAACFLVMECEFDANVARKGDCYSALHIAAQANLMYMCMALPELMADVNAVANDDEMPLSLAIKGGNDKAAAVLKKKGGKETWRKDNNAGAALQTSTDLIQTATLPGKKKGGEAGGAPRFAMSAPIVGGNEEEEEEFVKADAFAGERKGFVFKSGDRGVGYYGNAAEDGDEDSDEEPARDFSCGE
jgi:hypothetical protein